MVRPAHRALGPVGGISVGRAVGCGGSAKKTVDRGGGSGGVRGTSGSSGRGSGATDGGGGKGEAAWLCDGGPVRPYLAIQVMACSRALMKGICVVAARSAAWLRA